MLRLGEGVRWVTGGTGGFFGWLILFGGVQCWVGLMDTKPPAGTLLYNKWQKVLDIWVEVCKN